MKNSNNTTERAVMSSTPPAVRILPMDSQLEFEGRSIEEVQRTFFFEELLRPNRPAGKYRYREKGLNAETGSVVLFQYEGKIIASAILIEVERFPTPERGTYHGAFYFDPNSIKVFDPIGPEVIAGIWPEFSGFSHVKQILDPRRFTQFEGTLTGVEKPKM
jgi:hypothetical protein